MAKRSARDQNVRQKRNAAEQARLAEALEALRKNGIGGVLDDEAQASEDTAEPEASSPPDMLFFEDEDDDDELAFLGASRSRRTFVGRTIHTRKRTVRVEVNSLGGF